MHRSDTCLFHHLHLSTKSVVLVCSRLALDGETIKPSGLLDLRGNLVTMAVDFSMSPQRPRVPPLFPSSTKNTDSTTRDRKLPIPPLTSDRIDRTSFSSIKESNSGGAQSFTDSKTSSYLRNEYRSTSDEVAIDDSDSGSATPIQQRREEMAGVLNPQSTLHGLVCPCDGFKGWKSISVGGKIASKSFGDLHKLRMRWDWDTTTVKPKEEKMDLDVLLEKQVMKVEEGKYASGHSAFELLPMELLCKLELIISLLYGNQHSRKSPYHA